MYFWRDLSTEWVLLNRNTVGWLSTPVKSYSFFMSESGHRKKKKKKSQFYCSGLKI